MTDRDWEMMIGRLVIYRKGWRWTAMWRSDVLSVDGYSFRYLVDMNGDKR